MIRNLRSLLTVGAFYVALSTYLLAPAVVAAQTPAPPQGPPPASPNAQGVTVNNLSLVLARTIQPAIDVENAALATNPSFHAVITPTVLPAGAPSMSSNPSLYRPSQLVANVPFTILYKVTNISAFIGNAWVEWDGETAIIGQEVFVTADCEGWFTGRGTLTYFVGWQPASYSGTTLFPNPQTGVFLEQIIPNFVNTAVNPIFANYGTGLEGELVSSGAACRTLGTPSNPPPPSADPAYILFDPAGNRPPVTTVQNSVTVKVTRIHRLELHGVDGLPIYETVENPVLVVWAGFTEIQFNNIPAMKEGDTFEPTTDNEATTLVPFETGTLVVLGIMSYGADVPHVDPTFISFSRNLDFGSGKQTLYTTKKLLSLSNGLPAYEITLEITAPPVSTGTAQ